MRRISACLWFSASSSLEEESLSLSDGIIDERAKRARGKGGDDGNAERAKRARGRERAKRAGGREGIVMLMLAIYSYIWVMRCVEAK